MAKSKTRTSTAAGSGAKSADAGARPFPTKEEILAFIEDSPGPVGQREIARAFRIEGGERIQLKALMRELRREGTLERRPKRKVGRRGHLPAVTVLEVSGIDADGELLARPAVWDQDTAPPTIYLAPEKRSRSALAVGDRVLARLRRIDGSTYEARPIHRIVAAPRRVLGIYEVGDEGGRLRPTDRRARKDFILREEDAAGAQPGELVLAEVRSARPRLGLRAVRVLERLGAAGSPRALSLIAIHEHDLPVAFSPEALAEAEAAGPAGLGERGPGARVDLRDLPLVTIDGADARDFDDAVWAEPDPDPANPGGWHVLVAIADVAWYVRPDSGLDRAAFERGNSAYFPDRVVPMLPEALSNGWCSLNPDQERPCLAAELWIDAAGNTRRHRFLRGLMRSAARLTYEQVQAARDGRPDQARSIEQGGIERDRVRQRGAVDERGHQGLAGRNLDAAAEAHGKGQGHQVPGQDPLEQGQRSQKLRMNIGNRGPGDRDQTKTFKGRAGIEDGIAGFGLGQRRGGNRGGGGGLQNR